jgi:hypothetical protein
VAVVHPTRRQRKRAVAAHNRAPIPLTVLMAPRLRCYDRWHSSPAAEHTPSDAEAQFPPIDELSPAPWRNPP